MIQANELRIGNLVGNNDTVVSIDYDYKKGYSIEVMDFIGGTMYVEDSELKPIPLTEYWLLKFGFTLKDKDNSDDFDTYSLNGIEVWEHSEGFCHGYAYGQDVFHVHQLQNLYFALTGSELVLSTVPEATKPAL